MMYKMSPQTEQRIGEYIREWRMRRHLSQLELAQLADVSTRHLSFLESGRAHPSREMIARLAQHLQIPFRQVNAMLKAAGFSDMYPAGTYYNSYDAPSDAMRMLLQSHEPYPALIVDKHWNLLANNKAMNLLLSDVDVSLLEEPINTMRLSLHPQGLAPRILNLSQWSAHIFERLSQDIANSDDEFLVGLREELLGYGINYSTNTLVPSKDPVVPLKLQTSYGSIAIFGMTTIFGTPNDITLSELAVESFFPMDEKTKEILKKFSLDNRQSLT